ncbi:AraC family transcriptional regulator [Flavobacterium sp. PL002]|uniref:helix-turn-helix domain-containing protein n=1 Tax=Flavobacterium sp. PL002 TaxID=1897058 RepID=UPI001787BB11|nr:helix-turn-helix domain-containing protein [Flavobacterium sp. PL002]MBE0393855.1 hypothetical protein [Flavobacterium sp. PL002]
MKPYFIFSESMNESFKDNYGSAISKLTTALSEIKKNKDFADETIASFYIGKNYWIKNDKDKAIVYFKKIEKIFDKEKYINPKLREAFELIINYYTLKNDKKQQLHYSQKLIKADQVVEKKHQYLSEKTTKKNNTNTLLEPNKTLINTINYPLVTVITAIATLITLLYNNQYFDKKIFKKPIPQKFETIKPSVPASVKELPFDLNPELITAILKKLEKFESTKKYLEKDINLIKLATILNTNTKYVSKVIAKYRNKGSIEYITDFKIDHIIHLLKEEKKYRNYTNKALGDEAGFGSTQNFTRAFLNRTGISPTYFIKELNKSVKPISQNLHPDFQPLSS